MCRGRTWPWPLARRRTRRRLVKLLKGFAGWYLAGTLVWVLLRTLLWVVVGVYMKPSTPRDLVVCATLNLAALGYLGTRPRFRFIALGALAAMAVNFYALREIGYSGDLGLTPEIRAR